MYRPRAFRNDDTALAHALMQRYDFALLLSSDGARVDATHVPFLLDADRGRYGTLLAHLARANPHWQRLEHAQCVKVVFLGPHAYISPGWYANQRAVPTWDYAAVHASGPVRIVHERDWLLRLVERTADRHEADLGNPWDRSQAEPGFASEIGHIVGVEIAIEHLEGQYKFSQNRTAEDRAGVVRELQRSAHPDHLEVAEWVRTARDRR